MPSLGERAYAYAKASGIIGKSFIGKRAQAISNVNRLSELDRLIFPNSSRDLPEKELIPDLETRISKRTIDSVQRIIKSFNKPPKFFVLLTKELKRQNEGDLLQQTEQDRLYYNSLLQALQKLKTSDRCVTQKILAEEISLRNAACALRLRTYYHLDAKEVVPHLIDIKMTLRGKRLLLAADALSSLVMPLDSRESWTGWKREKFLNPSTGGSWTADPRYFQNTAAKYLYRMARHAFRFSPSSLDTVFCFIKMKQFEEDVLTSSAEGLRMGLSSGEVFSMLGVES
ncbi:MAG: V-type ATPase subunit [Treponema sp.]|jgi:vacuolar-type H+-ATPase subunit C/Vma6|nr:V-type ATPase subunit [Treponema sp.]